MSAGVMAASFVAAPSYSALVLADSPLAYYRLNETSGTVVADSSGNSRDASWTSSRPPSTTGLITGDPDPAVLLSSGVQTAGRSADAALHPNILTAELLFNPTTVVASGLFSCDQDANHKAWGFHITAAGKLEGQCYNSSGTGTVITGTTTIVAGTRYHAALVRDASGMRIYLNGVLEASSAAVTTAQATSGITIGGWRGSAQFQGTIDEAAIYGTALTPTNFLARKAAAGF